MAESVEPFHDDGQVTLYQGDVRAVLRGMDPESVNCVITSPPYWSLRDYGVEPTVWGGSLDGYGFAIPKHATLVCDPHEWGEAKAVADAYVGTARWQHDGISRVIGCQLMKALRGDPR